MHKSQPARQHRQRREASAIQGFTLIELLVVVAVGSIVLAGAIAMMLSHIRSSSILAALLRLQDQCGRVQFLLNHEIQQAELATSNGNSLSLTIPGVSVPIIYNQDGNELFRTGPEIDELGRLVSASTPSSELVARGVVNFEPDTENPRAPTYTLTVRDANGVTYSTRSTSPDNRNPDPGAHCRVREITGDNGG